MNEKCTRKGTPPVKGYYFPDERAQMQANARLPAGARPHPRQTSRKERRIEAVKRSVALKRAALKLASMPRAAKKLMYSALSRARSEEIAAINATCRRERQATDQQHRRYQWNASASPSTALTLSRE